MIFVTLGSQKFQFNRLLKAIDDQIADGKIMDQVFAQSGASDYEPRLYSHKDYLNRDEFDAWTRKADIVITHGGTGAIVGAIKKEKKVIAIPRLARYGEHVDDHQRQLIDQFSNQKLILKCENCDEIWRTINVAKSSEFCRYKSNTNRILRSIDQFVGEI